MADSEQKMPEPAVTQATTPEVNPAEKKLDMERITPGERFYDVSQFLFGKIFILAATAALAFTAHQKYGPDKIGPFKNYLKDFQGWAERKFAPLAKIGEEGSKKRDLGLLMSGGLTSATILMHGGNAFSPFLKSFENNREKITNWYNKKFSTEEDVEIAHEKFKDIPKQNWLDVIKGRAAGFVTVFSTVSGAYLAFGRSKGTQHHFKLDTYEDWFGRKVAWLTKGSRDIAKVPMSEVLTELQQANKTYRFGKVLAIDLFATSTSIIVWNTVSRLSAKNRADADHKTPATEAPVAPADNTIATQESAPAATHADKITPCCKKEKLLEGKTSSYAKLVAAQQQTAEQQAHTISG